MMQPTTENDRQTHTDMEATSSSSGLAGPVKVNQKASCTWMGYFKKKAFTVAPRHLASASENQF